MANCSKNPQRCSDAQSCADQWDRKVSCSLYGEHCGNICGDTCRFIRCDVASPPLTHMMLTLTLWFASSLYLIACSNSIKLSGRRKGGNGVSQPGDSFTQEETLTGIVPNCGPIAITTRVYDINPGEWTVTVSSPANQDAVVWTGFVPGNATIEVQL